MNDLINCIYVHSIACVFGYQVACYEASPAAGRRLEIVDSQGKNIITITQRMFNKYHVQTQDTLIISGNDLIIQQSIHHLLEQHHKKSDEILSSKK